MSQAVPNRIGPYRVIREIGRGGMGVVFLARDTKLDRDVAIKALPSALAEDAERMARFEREAKTLAQLSHTHVAGIHGVEEQDGQRYLILEYVEGETLADRLDRGPLPADEAVEIAIDIAAGVEAAHETGIVHRDLKPDNVKISPDGKVKVLDFGLARTDDGASGSSVTDAATVTSSGRHSPTMAGTILGTAAYMSPEQARGRRVDKRTDIWSFGVVLYEMLAGSSLFHGETATDTIGAVLHKDFSVDGIPEDTPRMVRHVLHRCLQRDKTRRFQSIGDVRIELEDALKRMEAGERDELGPARSGRRAWVWPVLAACFALTTLACLGLWLTKTAAPNDGPLQPTTPTVLTVEQITDFPVNMRRAAISPDAATVIYAAHPGTGGADLYRLRIGGATPFRLTGGPDAHENHPAISPDGESIAYWSAGETPGKRGIFLMGATGESPRRIVEPPAYFPAWSPDGRSLAYTTEWWSDAYSRASPGALWVVDLATRQRRMIDTADPEAGADPTGWASDAVSPTWSPDGTRIAYWGVRGGTRDIFTVSPAGGDVIRVTDDVHTDWNPIWGPDGRSIWFLSDRGGQPGIWSIALTEDGKPADDPRPIVLGPGRITQASLAADGRKLVALVVSGRYLIERVRFDPQTERFVGTPELLLESSTAIQAPDISRDGEWIAFHSAAPQEDITVMRLDGTGRRRLTEGTAKDRVPRWTPDGKTLYYASNESGNYELRTIDRDTAEAIARPVAGEQSALAPAISPDGSRIAFQTSGGAGTVRIAKLAEDGSVLDARAAPDGFGPGISSAWSADNRWISGQSATPDGVQVRAVLDTEADAVVLVQMPDGAFCPWFASVSWIDATRLLARRSEQVFVFDAVSGEARWVEDPPTDLGSSIAVHPDGWIYTEREEGSSNLWLVTLEGTGKE